MQFDTLNNNRRTNVHRHLRLVSLCQIRSNTNRALHYTFWCYTRKNPYGVLHCDSLC